MTYLTQVTLDFETVARLRWRDNYEWHKAIWEAFPGRDGQQRDFLTRLDRRPEGFRLLIVSPVEPVQPGWYPAGSGSWKTRPIPDTYFTRRRYVFQLCANPTKKVAKFGKDGPPTKNGRRVPLRKREELAEWIARKGEQGGFVTDEATLRIFSRGRESFEKKVVDENGQEKSTRGLHSAVEFQGVLTVTDPKRFYEAFRRGIGSAKAFGFGLLVIAPTR